MAEQTVGRIEQLTHTPGPWVVDNCGRDVRAGGVGGLFVARIYAVPQEDNPAGYGDEQFANARLVAAAPELLQALREIVGDCYVLDPESRTGQHPKLREEDLAHCRFCDHAEGKAHDADCTMHFVLAAIARAEGR